MEYLGLDVGGSGVKGALVDAETGEMKTERHRIKTPKPATPEAIAATAATIAEHFSYSGPIGVGFPAPLKHRPLRSMANLDKSWVGKDPAEMISKAAGAPTFVLNDADAAALAEVRFGGGRGVPGVILFLTLGTGIGTALVADGELIENTEIGHMYLENGMTCEQYAAESAKDRADLSMKDWGKRLNTVLAEYEKLFWPDAIVLGGGGGKKFDKFSEYIKIETPIRQATLKNSAGMIGAAIYAAEHAAAPSGSG